MHSMQPKMYITDVVTAVEIKYVADRLHVHIGYMYMFTNYNSYYMHNCYMRGVLKY